MHRFYLLITGLIVTTFIMFLCRLPNLNATELTKGEITEELRGLLSTLGQGNLYYNACATCHGLNGNGRGPSAYQLNPKPLDFRRGLFKCRSTPWGSLPTDGDIFRSITRGLPGTTMPSWELLLSGEQRWNLVQRVKTFSPRWETEKPEAPIVIPPRPDDLETPESIAMGKDLYLKKAGCVVCHGNNGKGDGPIADELTDAWGQPIKPTDFTKGVYICGDSARDIYRTLVTGLNGTPMPSFGVLPSEELWLLVAYVKSLKKKRNLFDHLVKEN
ncbi:c-type cytochrome [Desulfobacterota bacterium AH_259_B03_O07]|nr:c-type cytochrome [Desulfobacterota bacterium AH_259_B03_O07]